MGVRDVGGEEDPPNTPRPLRLFTMSFEEERRDDKHPHQCLYDLKDLLCEVMGGGGKRGVVQGQLGQGVDMICGRRVDRQIHHHRPAYSVVAAATVAMVEAAAGVIISWTLQAVGPDVGLIWDGTGVGPWLGNK